MSRDSIGIDWIRRIPKIVSILIVVASVVYFYSYEGSLVPLFAGSYPYSADSMVNVWTRLIQLCSAFAVGVSILSLVPDFKDYSKMGRKTLFIYMYHTFLIQLVFVYFTRMLNCDSIIILVLCALCNFALLLLLSKVKLLNVLLNPVSYIIERKGKRI